jgi:hypothetical protein
MTRCLTLIVLLLPAMLAAHFNPEKLNRQQPPDVMRRTFAFSYAGGPVVSFFKNDTRMSEATKPLPGFTGMFRLHLSPSTSFHVQIGMEVMTQACSFNTYYFAPGFSTFYDSAYDYTHRLRTLELYVPIMFRAGLTSNEANARAIFYLLGGYAPKVFIGSSTDVSKRNGGGIWGGSTQLTFENWFLGNQTGNVLMAGFGIDKRIKMTEKFISFEVLYRYNLSRFIYTGRIDTNELLIKNSCITVQVGYKFEGGKAKKGY